MNVVIMASREYASYFGFTENEVFVAMDEFGLANKEEVRQWYDGFTIGDLKDIYELELTNYEVRKMFEAMVSNWFRRIAHTIINLLNPC